MGLYLEDGGGSGKSAQINSEGRLLTSAVTASLEHHANHQGHAYNVLFEQTPDGVDDCIFYMKNESETDAVVEGITLSATALCHIRVERSNSGTASSPTTLTPVNLNGGSGLQADGTFQTGSSLGFDSSSVVELYRFSGDTTSKYFNFEQDIILPKNRSITLWCVMPDSSGDVPTIYGTVIFHYHPLAEF